MHAKWDDLWVNGCVVTCEQAYGLVPDAALAVSGGKIAWVGPVKELPGAPRSLAKHVHDAEGVCITPGFIDCHTHIVYAGNRVNEFEQRLNGMTYEEIARQGGGIQSTILATRAATAEELFKQSLTRVLALLASGVTTIEIKSGYGLDLTTELKILQVATLLENSLPVTVSKTFLGAHIIPEEYADSQQTYVDLLCNKMIPLVAEKKLANAVDVFCEKIAFDLQQTEMIFQTAVQFGLAIKCHAEQLSDLGASVLAAKYHALSVDHLEYTSKEGVRAIAESGSVAVLLPGAFYFLRETKRPPIELLRAHRVPIAIASDCNPGTSPITSLLIILNMSCILFGLTPEEALLGVTCNAAKALNMESSHGTLTVGKAADFALWDINHPAELCYYLGANPLKQLIKNGTRII